MRVLLLLALTLPAAAADPPPRVKVQLSPAGDVLTGQRVSLVVTLYTPDFFAGVPTFDLPPIPGVVAMPPGSGTVGSETIGGDSFTTQRRELALYAQRPGAVKVPAFPIHFETNAGFGKPTVSRQVTTEAVSFTAKPPPGAEKLGTVIATRALRVTDEWNPKPTAAKVGDACTRTVTVTTADVPGMVIPPFRLDAIDGLTAYPKEPAVSDRTERGDLTGQRTETITYVCERAGSVTVPDRTLSWWSLEDKQLKTEKLHGVTFEVAAAPAAQAETPPDEPAKPAERVAWKWIIGAAAILAVLVLGWRLLLNAHRRFHRWRVAQAESEHAYFAHLRQACHGSDPHAAYQALLKWLDCRSSSLDDLLRDAADPVLSKEVAALKARVYAPTAPSAWAGAALLARLEIARHHLRSPRGRSAAPGSLPALNPS